MKETSASAAAAAGAVVVVVFIAEVAAIEFKKEQGNKETSFH